MKIYGNNIQKLNYTFLYHFALDITLKHFIMLMPINPQNK